MPSDMSTGIMKDTYRSVVASAHLAFYGVEIAAGADSDAKTPSITGVLQFSTSERPNQFRAAGSQDVLALCRPPGHHCDTRRAGGYCYANNAVVAVRRFLQGRPGKRVAILDIDYHHGNGTQEYFYDRSDVLYVSIHGQDEYPYYTGAEHETGIGDGEGFNLNLPLPPRSSMEAYMGKLGFALSRIETFAPDLLIISLGFDTYRLDPLGGFDIDTQDYKVIASRIRQQLSGMPALILLEGGYVLDDLGKNLLAFLDGWEAVGSNGKMIAFMINFCLLSSCFGSSYLARTDLRFCIWIAESCFGWNFFGSAASHPELVLSLSSRQY